MHCYRITTFNPGDPVYILRATQQEAFSLARATTTTHHSPVVALIDLPTNKDDVIKLANDPMGVISNQLSLKAWEFYLRGTQATAREIEPNTGEPKASAQAKRWSAPVAPAPLGGYSKREPKKPANSPNNPFGWPAEIIHGKK